MERREISQDFEVNGIRYKVIGNNASVTSKCDHSGKYSGEVAIPSTINYNDATYSVTSIDSHAFEGCSELTNITIPNSVTSIGKKSFYGCSSLMSVTIGNSVNYIGERAFLHCSNLTNIIVVSDNTVYDSREDCNGIIETASNTLIVGCKNTIIPNSVTTIGKGAFYRCSGLTCVTIPKSVTSIGIGAFSDCSGLTNIIVVGDNTVYDSREDCNGIIETASNTLISGCKNTIIPNSVTSIGDDAFFGCSGLTSLTIPQSVTSIGYGAFYGCYGLTSVTIPNSVTCIGMSAFDGCSGLTSIGIPNSIDSIGGLAFYGCSGLTSIDIPNSVTVIDKYAFVGCSRLTSVTIPNSVTCIGMSAFGGCSGLTNVTIGNSVTFIGEGAFSGCCGLKDVYLYITDLSKVTSGLGLFYLNINYYSDRTLHVPTGTRAAYQADERWSDYFGSIVEM